MVSVIIPVYNRETTVMRAVKSVLNQTIKDLELIIVDDGSTDESIDIIKSINDRRIRILKSDHKGACHARNVGIKNALGEFVAFHDSDDIWKDTKLEIQFDIMQKYSPDIIFCKLNKIVNGKMVDIWPNKTKQGFLPDGENLLGIGTQTLFAKREVFQNLLFDEEMRRFQELEMLIRAKKNGYRFYCIDEGLVDYYVGSDSISSDVSKRVNAYDMLYKKHSDINKISLKMSSTIANSLLLTAAEQQRNGQSYKDTMLVAKKYNMTIILKIKYILINLEIYNRLKRKW